MKLYYKINETENQYDQKVRFYERLKQQNFEVFKMDIKAVKGFFYIELENLKKNVVNSSIIQSPITYYDNDNNEIPEETAKEIENSILGKKKVKKNIITKTLINTEVVINAKLKADNITFLNSNFINNKKTRYFKIKNLGDTKGRLISNIFDDKEILEKYVFNNKETIFVEDLVFEKNGDVSKLKDIICQYINMQAH